MALGPAGDPVQHEVRRRDEHDLAGIRVERILARPQRTLPHATFTFGLGRFGLTPDSLKRVDADPLAPLATLAPDERALLTREFQCVGCHSFRGAGGRASHLRALDAEKVGGYGLPLEEYPAPVWRRYCFEQEQVAKEIGATPVPLGARARELFEIVERERGGAETAR